MVEESRGLLWSGEMASGEGAARLVLWDEVAAGTSGDDAPVGVGIAP